MPQTWRGFLFLPREYKMPAVIAGFEPEDILLAVYRLLRQIAYNRPELENEYRRAVAPDGNPLAQKILEECFEPRRDIWRGLGEIEASGLGFKEELARFLALGLGEDVNEKILYGNFMKLFDLHDEDETEGA